MTSYRVVPKVTIENTTLVAGAARKSLKVPSGVTAYDPIRVSFGEMSKKEPTKLPPPAGLTKCEADFEVPGAERITSEKTTQWKFTGGDIILNVKIGIYIIDRYAPVSALFKLIMEHEYLHLRDYLNLANKDIDKKIEADTVLKPWLAGEPWTGAAFYDRLAEVWDLEAERLGNILDSGPEYERHKREIAKLAPRI